MADNVTLTRVIDLVAQESITDGDYTLIDSVNGGTKRYNLGSLAERMSGGLTEEIKQALLQIAEKVAYIDDQGQSYYDALEDALYPPTNLVSISAVYTQSGTVYDTDTLDSLKSDLVVTAHYSDQTTETVTTYMLSGTLMEGTSTITVVYGGKTTTFTVTVTHTALVPGTHTFSNDSYITVRGNHVKVYASKTYDGKTGYQFNFLDINDNTLNALTSTDNANNKSSKFTIPANTPCILSINNVIANGVYTHNSTGTGGQSLVFGNRIALSTSNAGSDTIFGSNTTYSETAEGYPTGDYTRTFTLESATDIGSMYVYFGHADAGGTMEFDVVLTVGGTRVI